MPLAPKSSSMTHLSTRLVLLSLVLAPGLAPSLVPGLARAGEYEYFDPSTGVAGGFCAGLGKGYVPVQGTRACVKIGGHVRVDAAADLPLRTASGDGQANYGQPVDGPMRAHLRLDGPQH